MRFEFSRLWPGNVKEPPRETLAEIQARLDAAPAGTWIKVDTPYLEKIQTPQTLTMEHDLKEASRALSLGYHKLQSGESQMIVTGPVCKVCGQAGIAYKSRTGVRILVCERMEKSLANKFRELRANYGCEDGIEHPLPGTLIFKGFPIESIGCGKNLKMHLRMRYCWFD